MNKTKPTDFARVLSEYLFNYLPSQKGLSKNTIDSYSDALGLFLDFYENQLNIKRERLEIKQISKETVEQFLMWLEQVKKNSVSTVNQRRISLNSFFKYLQYENPGHVLLCQQILSIPHKNGFIPQIQHLSVEAIEEILKRPNLNTKNGRRDFALLSLLYESAARVSEIANLCVGDIRVVLKEPIVHLFGKGKKSRDIPLITDVAAFLTKYIEEEKRYRSCEIHDPLFCNNTKSKLTRAGIAYVVNKYASQARMVSPDLFPNKISPHILRHSRAMHWLESGVDLYCIKGLLGHEDLKTTEVYARLSTKMKRKILEEAHPPDKTYTQYPSWTEDENLMDWIRNFKNTI